MYFFTFLINSYRKNEKKTLKIGKKQESFEKFAMLVVLWHLKDHIRIVQRVSVRNLKNAFFLELSCKFCLKNTKLEQKKLKMNKFNRKFSGIARELDEKQRN